MADNQLIITAGLNIPETVQNIQSDLDKKVAPQVHLDIACNIDTSNIKAIQTQVASLSNNLKIDIGANKIDSIIDEKSVKNQAKALSDALELAIPKGKTKEVRDTIQGLINDYQKALQAGNYNDMVKAFDNLDSYVDRFRKDVQVINSELVETQQKIKEISRSGKTFVSESDYNELSYLLGGKKNASSMLSKAFGVGNWTKDKLKATTSWDSKVQSINDLFDSSRVDSLVDIDSGRFNDHIDGVISLVEYLNKTFDDGADFVKEYGDEIQKAFSDQLYSALNNILGISENVEGEFVEIFNPNEIQATTQEVQNLGNAIQNISGKLPDISIGASTKETLESAKATLNEYFSASADTAQDKANRVKRAIEDTSGELQRFYVQVEKGDKSVETLTYALNEQGNAYTYLGKTIREADNSTAFRHQDITTQWAEQTEKLKAFISKAEKAGAASTLLGTEISNLKAKLAEGGDTSAMNAFLDDFDIAKAKLQAFNAEATKNNAIANLSNRIRKLSADVNAYAESNKRAVESTKKMADGKTFAEQWSNIMAQMAKGAQLSDREVKNLATDLAVFKKEASAAGLAGATAFEKFANAFKLVSTYISANQIINMVTRQIRSAVSELQSMDDILTEISKTSDRTEESLRALGKSSFDVASSYGRTASDYLLGVQEMSRAGFGEKQSETLSELSLKAQAAGDMTAEMANQYIIATNAAYSLGGSEQKLNSVLDSQNYITNRNAVNMESLAEATKIAASQAAASGVEINELTSAVGTMIATTQQGGEIAGRAFKGKRVINTIARHRCESMIA